jgi:4-amino-4-deoxy-L-arabinose transferase-like glycosyltransferase
MPAAANEIIPVVAPLEVKRWPSRLRSMFPELAGSHVWSILSCVVLIAIWLPLEFCGIFSPGLLDDVDSVYIESAREMLVRHDFVTPYIDGVRFFDKPPLMYWLAAIFMKVFGVHDWAARLPLAILSLGLFLAVHFVGSHLFGQRGGFYSAIITATSMGPYLFTRFFIPDVPVALWMTLAVLLFLKALHCLDMPSVDQLRLRNICWGFAVVVALNVLTKGLIGLVFPLALVGLYLLIARQFCLIPQLYPWSSAGVFLAVSVPWHVLAALRNPAVPGSVIARGWFWFYIVNEHFLRFLGKRIPHDYGQVPLPLFLVLAAAWLAPWASFLPSAVLTALRSVRSLAAPVRSRDAALILLLWVGIVLLFFCASSRQEYYSLPAVPAMALLVGGCLARAHERDCVIQNHILTASRWLLVPLSLIIAAVACYLAVFAPVPVAGADVASLLRENPKMYTVSLGHVCDLTGRAMALFRGPLAIVGIAMLIGGPLSHHLRCREKHLASNITLAFAAVVVLLCVHEGLTRFYPILGSKSLALKINHAYHHGDMILIDGEYTLGSSINFYTQHPVSLVDGRMNGTWYGSYWPDALGIFETTQSLHDLWSSQTRLFLVTHSSSREQELARYGLVYRLASSGGKAILTNRP